MWPPAASVKAQHAVSPVHFPCGLELVDFFGREGCETFRPKEQHSWLAEEKGQERSPEGRRGQFWPPPPKK